MNDNGINFTPPAKKTGINSHVGDATETLVKQQQTLIIQNNYIIELLEKLVEQGVTDPNPGVLVGVPNATDKRCKIFMIMLITN